MLALPDHPLLDKQALIGGCVRLGLRVDAARLRAEIEAMPAETWGNRGGGRIGVHRPAEAVFFRGYAPADGELPIEDRAELALVPYVREIIEQLVPAPVMRCLAARLRAGGIIAPHIDLPDYFGKTIRLHIPVITDPSVLMVAQERCYRMQPGEVWALNNSGLHAVVNGWDSPRTHLICDFLSSPELLRLLREGERGLGFEDRRAIATLAAAPMPARG